MLGDESGYVATEHQKMKIAAVEGMWETEEPPASFTVIGMPDMEARRTEHLITVPWALGLIATRSISERLPGIFELVDHGKERIRSGILAYDAVERLRRDPADAEAQALFRQHESDFGYALLLRRFIDDPRQATEADIDRAAWLLVPDVPSLFWSFRIMVGLGFWFILLFGVSLYAATRRRYDQRWLLRLALLSLPLPWVAAELGWIVAEYGRQPWVIEGVLPTFFGVSSIDPGRVWFSLTGFVLFYTTLLVVDVYLMVKYARKGPAELGEPPAGRADRAGAQALVTPSE